MEANKKKKTNSKTTKKSQTQNKSKGISEGKSTEILCLCLAALSVIFIICVYTSSAGKLGTWLSAFLCGLFGTGAYVAPLVSIAMIGHYFFGKSENKKKKYILSWIAFLDFTALCHMIFVPQSEKWNTYFKFSCKNPGGGLVGALLAEPLKALMEQTCTYIVLITLMAVLCILIFNVSFASLVKKLMLKIRFSVDKAKQEIDGAEIAVNKSEIANKVSVPEKGNEKNISADDASEQPTDTAEQFTYHEPEINIYNEKPKDEKISKDEKDDFHKEIQKEISDNGENHMMIYKYPDIELLTAPKKTDNSKKMSNELKDNAVKLVETLRSFHVDAQVVEISCGPTVTRYEIKPAAGVKVSQVTNLSKDIALKLAAKGGVMIAPVSGKSTIGIEIANAHPSVVTLREVLESEEFKNHASKLAVALGKDISGAPVIMDLAKMPHLLIAGATGAGKSVCINTLVISLIYKADPNEVKLVMIDPKQVELGVYNGIPHLLIPVVKDAKKATGALSWAVQEMTERYSVFEKHNVRNIQGYNELMESEGTPENKMPSIVIIIDEFADLMMVAPGDVENYVCRIAQLARAAGMHLVIATQRPVVKFITGNIKANVPSRISFMVASVKDSQTILDMGGAEKLVGKGDMLYMPVGETKPARMQCAFVSDADVKKVVEEVSSGCEPEYSADVMEQLEKEDEYMPDGADPGEADELLPEAIEMAIDNGQISTSLLQRRFRIGYNRAGSIIDQMEARGIISGLDGNRPRQALITREQYNEMLMK